MKRSEMLKIIADFIRTEFEPKTFDGSDLSHPIAVSLLDLIEDEGMQPPKDPILLLNKWKSE